ncbi:g2187 [Coccomyxa viridis]|uniref:G2187 protein n=1 Tax=Coccomyxa viridis TaxID=1274662 RepID=A0ABP1FLE5_9CHLO
MVLQKSTVGELPFYYGGPSHRPAVIVLQEWWGVTPEVIQHAEYISEKGNYKVVVPDLYRGKTGVDAEEASHLADGLDFGRATEDIKEVVEWTRSSGSQKVGVTGFCQGGALSCLAAEHTPVSCAVPFYGYPKSHPSKPESIKVPIMAHVGTEDKFFPCKEVEEYVEKIKAGGGNATVHVYPGEGHAFMNSDPDSFKRMETAGIPKGKPEDQELAWKRTFDFFKQHLG